MKVKHADLISVPKIFSVQLPFALDALTSAGKCRKVVS